jgi:hypothetical protein
MEKKLKKEKERTKKHEHIISRFVNKVHSAYKSKNEELYVRKMMEIYNEFVREHVSDIIENKRKDPEIIEELARQLLYLEKSSNTLKDITHKNQTKTKVNINKRRQENKVLIENLEEVRMKKRELEETLRKKRLDIQQLKLERQKK